MIYIVVRWDQEGSHCWPEAPAQHVMLRNLHGHIFNFECRIPVTQEDRQLEFLEVRRYLEQLMRERFGDPCRFGSMSCEGLARWVQHQVLETYSVGAIVRVMEDSFVGALVDAT